ncbi:unnamed protein product [Caretta caretta]
MHVLCHPSRIQLKRGLVDIGKSIVISCAVEDFLPADYAIISSYSDSCNCNWRTGITLSTNAGTGDSGVYKQTAMRLALHVADEMDVNTCHEVGYVVPFESCSTTETVQRSEDLSLIPLTLYECHSLK